MFRHQVKFATESRIPPQDNVTDDLKTTQFEYCAVRQSVGWESTAHKCFESSSANALCNLSNSKNRRHRSTTLERDKLSSPYTASIHRCIPRPPIPPPPKTESLLVVPSYSPACSVVDDNVCKRLLFGVKPHCNYGTSKVAHASVSLPINGTTIHADYCDDAVQQPFITVSLCSNPTIVKMSAEAGIISKHNLAPICCPCPPFIAPLAEETPMVFSEGLLTGHDCLCAHLFRFNLVTSPICVLCDTGKDMTAAHLDECSALNDLNCIVKRHWRARCLMT
ncbi:uncharacterized protein TNCV_1074161 [Trichonephila clavipes]|uniref:Uncharacterized protein n=1 Tax=Trichonephila clavipes TaxID=2585209 RepID=A0A8X6SQE2_TRICX|nr:uncharacterized protein TNCV_1074161 [Trichonephila clavipes]